MTDDDKRRDALFREECGFTLEEYKEDPLVALEGWGQRKKKEGILTFSKTIALWATLSFLFWSDTTAAFFLPIGLFIIGQIVISISILILLFTGKKQVKIESNVCYNIESSILDWKPAEYWPGIWRPTMIGFLIYTFLDDGQFATSVKSSLHKLF